MPISPYIVHLRRSIGRDLLLLPAVTVLPRDEAGRLLLVRHFDTGLWVVSYGSRGGLVADAPRLVRVDGFAAHLAAIAAGGVVGRHPAPIWQLFAVVNGSGWVAGADGVRQPIRPGGTVLWEPGEEHESGSDEGMLVVVIEAPVRLPHGE